MGLRQERIETNVMVSNSTGHSLGIFVFVCLFAILVIPLIIFGTDDVERYEEIGKNVSIKVIERLNSEGYVKDKDNSKWDLRDVKLTLNFEGKGEGQVKTINEEYEFQFHYQSKDNIKVVETKIPAPK
ncbi:hypothetical protein JOC86_002235 [Bacillus pakistanensis]|uniref:DUF4845 domain-containing protein n=1 Tax=Rossellomorea pakistanensis TaxID=992288 RepID=A0ABS2NCU5_9BACI|nr:hypothetical protein [Bacillus pakistanensis]MBM7585693.1 hypothetical protein [Bacillus pakistanensis]